ncbi:SAM-dependent methyltransferase [Saccharothrix coeruleofusca]|uniref:SAM-dependent methyltransferase n=1 Tax=Saccharothrix coeruleofusca TaxID=33919 RepID=UPI00227D7E79|nr:SAM-dependent methyltransferase [Saccharothrix coeruleofusca]
MEQREWIPRSVDISVPSMARTYDFLLGGAHNFAVDRELAAHVQRVMPDARSAARVNRAFLGRVVRFMIGRGVRQFLDIGSGIPTVANVHEVAQGEDPRCRVVYVDKDPVAVAHSELMLADNDHATVVHADMRDPESILDDPRTRALLDFDQPIGLLLLMMLHWLPDEADPWRLMARYRDALPPGSHLAITHVTADHQERPLAEVTDLIKRSRSVDQLTERPHDRVLALFGDFELVEPGLVGCAQWRPTGPGDISDAPEMNMVIYGGVARKP